MHKKLSVAVAVFWVASILLLHGCGGSGDDSAQPPLPSNRAPIADAGVDRVVLQGSVVVLDGSASLDPDGELVAFQWAQTQGVAVTLADADTAAARFSAPETGNRETLQFQLTVQDDIGAQGSDTVTIVVNVPPMVDAGPDQHREVSATDTPPTITLTGTSSDDGTVVTHQWVQTDGPAVSLTAADTANATFTVAGTTTQAYTFRYTVTDDDGAQATDFVSVYVTRIIFADAFTDGDNWINRWTPVDESGNGAFWLVTSANNGQLRQNVNLERRAVLTGTSYKLGAYVVLNPVLIPSPRRYYRFSVDITPLPDFDRGGNDVGVMFGYLDANNYYRVSMNARHGFTRFEQRKNGVFSTLAVNAIGYIDNQAMTMTVEVNDDTIIIWIDGDPLFAVVDGNILAGTVALYCQDRSEFDNVRITQNPLRPLVVLATPLAYSVALTQDDSNALTAEAVVLNQPAGSSVAFTLFGQDDDSETALSGTEVMGVYVADFFGLAAGEYDLMAVLKDSAGRQLDHDINATVGIGGDYYVTVGDSITNGVGDAVPGNNDSADGRIVAIQGYQAPLADHLTNRTGRPQIVFNEGLGGDKAADLNARIDSILERHPGANRVLLMIGTNDSAGGTSSTDPETFGNTVSGIVGKMTGRQVWLARTMPTFINDNPISWELDETKNSLIRDYNAKMVSIAAGVSNAFLGPDFYFVFSSYAKPSDVYADFLHPNDAGYAVMADRWRNTLPNP